MFCAVTRRRGSHYDTPATLEPFCAMALALTELSKPDSQLANNTRAIGKT